jgi:hypothetical protein
MNYCTNCGKKRTNNSNYCSHCGVKFEIINESELGLNQNEEIISTEFINNTLESNIPPTILRNKVLSKILIFFENINGKSLLLYNVVVYAFNYTLGFFLVREFGFTYNVFFIAFLFDFVLGGAGFWFRSKQFPNGKLIFCCWAIGLLILDITQANSILFHIDLLTEFKYLYILFVTPTSWYLILKNNPNAKVKKVEV